MIARGLVPAVVLLATVARAGAQVPTRLAVLVAEDHRASTPRDLAVLRAAARGGDYQIRRIAVRALGRLERPSVIPDLVPSLKAEAPELRAEAANAIGQAAQGWTTQTARRAPAVRSTSVSRTTEAGASLDGVAAMLTARLKAEPDPGVRAALTETIGRLPYTTGDQVRGAEAALVQTARTDTVVDRLGIAKGAESLVRRGHAIVPPAADLLAKLRAFVASDPSRDARVRRLALEALTTADAIDEQVLARAAHDRDPQVRRLAVRAAAAKETGAAGATVVETARRDPQAMVRLEAIRSGRARDDDRACGASEAALVDPDTHVVLAALDDLAHCDAAALLDLAISDRAAAGNPRGWHRAAHAIVALATAAPDRAATLLPQFAGSTIWQVRMYAARAATTLGDRPLLEKLGVDESDNVREAAIEGLAKLPGHGSDAVYLAALERHGYQAVRAAATALAGTPAVDRAVPALEAAFQRLTKEGRENSTDVRGAIADTLAKLGSPVDAPRALRDTPRSLDVGADDLRRYASARARVVVRGVGTFELALISSEAPLSVIRFARLAEAGYYNGLTFHRVVPNFVIQGGSPDANEYVGDATFMRDELSLWPHVRGAVGISTRGRDTGDAQFFVDLVDNPRLDHQYTVFAQVLNGIDVVDAILEGDVIDRVEIVAP